MKCSNWILPAILLACAVSSTEAQFFFRKPRVAPSSVAELISTVKADPDERHRVNAALMLREYDAGQNPEIVPVLADVLYNDSKPSVRLEAAQTLARLRPVSPTAGKALEHAANSDNHWRVRFVAKTALVSYQLAGYRNGSTPTPGSAPTTQEPPLADVALTPAAPQQPTLPNPAVTIPVAPPLAPTNEEIIVINPPSTGPGLPATPLQANPVSMPRPLPQAPPAGGFSTASPQQPMRLPNNANLPK